MYKLFLVALLTLTLQGCTTMDISSLSRPTPELKIEEYFDGKVYAWGIFEDRFGNIRRQFQVEIDGTWDGKQLVLDEHFLYDDGERDRRIWTINKGSDGTYSGTADDVLGEAQGLSQGNSLNWSYELDLPVGDGTWRVTFDDWMILQEGGVLLNRAYVKKWGFRLGSVTLSFQRAEQLQAVPFSISEVAKERPVLAASDRLVRYPSSLDAH